MRKEQQKLLTLCFSPALVIVVICIAVLTRAPEGLNLVFSLIATIAGFTLSFAVHYHVSRRLIHPLQRLTDAVANGTAPAQEGNLLDPLTSVLRERFSSLEREHRQELDLVREDLMQTRRELAAANRLYQEQSRQIETTGNRQSKLNESNRQFSAALEKPLYDLVGRFEILAQREDNVALLTEAIASLGEIELLAGEIRQADYGNRPPAPFDIRQLTDESIAAFARVSPEKDVLPLFERQGQKHFTGIKPALRALVFHYIRIGSPPGPGRAKLDVACLASGSAAFALSPLYWDTNAVERSRFEELLAQLGGTMADGILQVPMKAEPEPLPLHTGSALVVAEDETTEALLARLESMGVQIEADGSVADYVIVAVDDDSRVRSLLEQRPPHQQLILLNNTTVYGGPNVIQLTSPLMHSELTMALSAPANAGRRQILIADDNDANRRLVAIHLEELGFEVLSASDANGAIAAAEKSDPAAAIVDLHMPGATGDSLVRRLRALRGSDFPLFVATATGDLEEMRRLRDAGATDVLLKPVTRQLLERILHEEATPRAAAPPATAPRTRELDHFDVSLSLRLANNRADLADELLEVLMEELPVDRASITAAWQDGDRKRTRRLVHRLNGGIQYCGVPRLRDAVEKLEGVLQKGADEDVRLALTVFDSEVNALLDWYDPDANYFATSIAKR